MMNSLKTLVVCTSLAACDGSHPGLLGEDVSAISSLRMASAGAAIIAAPQLDAGMSVSMQDAGAPAAMPAVPVAGSSAPPPPATAPMTSTRPTTSAQTAATPAMRKPDLVAVATQATGTLPVQTENFTCLTTDLALAEDTWVTAIEVAPQHPEYTFRASVSLGASCDALGITVSNVFDYFPSDHRLDLRDGDALLFAAGSQLNVQVHYSGIFAKAPSTDTQLTEVRLWTLPKGERPKYQVVRQNVHAFNISIPVGAVGQKVSTSADVDAEITQHVGAEIIGITPIIHFLGQGMTSGVVAKDGTESTILGLQNWSVDSRKVYWLDPADYIPLSSGAVHNQSCVYSNRPEDQALDADGNPKTPQLTTFGEDARSEQCHMHVLYRYPL